MKDSKYVYPAIFTPDPEGGYCVRFPDIDGCFTDGDSLPEAVSMAEDALALMLYEYEAEGKPVPAPSNLKNIAHESNEFVSYVYADTMEYRKKFNNKAVKKTLSIPEWLNEAATKANINFSQTLQEALKQKLGA